MMNLSDAGRGETAEFKVEPLTGDYPIHFRHTGALSCPARDKEFYTRCSWQCLLLKPITPALTEIFWLCEKISDIQFDSLQFYERVAATSWYVLNHPSPFFFFFDFAFFRNSANNTPLLGDNWLSSPVPLAFSNFGLGTFLYWSLMFSWASSF